MTRLNLVNELNNGTRSGRVRATKNRADHEVLYRVPRKRLVVDFLDKLALFRCVVAEVEFLALENLTRDTGVRRV